MVCKDKAPERDRTRGAIKVSPRTKLYEVKWLDAYEMESGWHSIEDALKITPPEVCSVGYVLKETEEYILLAADIGSDKMDNDVGRVQVIPGQWIVDKKEVK